MKVIIKEVYTDDWKAIYLNDEKVLEDHNIDIQDICYELQNLINGDENHKSINPIDSIKGEYYYLNEDYAEEYGFPDKFSDIPENMFG